VLLVVVLGSVAEKIRSRFTRKLSKNRSAQDRERERGEEREKRDKGGRQKREGEGGGGREKRGNTSPVTSRRADSRLSYSPTTYS
jgi:hypothetical protein